MPNGFEPAWREELVINIEGGEADRHELEAEIWGNSLFMGKIAMSPYKFRRNSPKSHLILR